jgi:hypothetical protein
MSYRHALIIVAALALPKPLLAQQPPSSWGVVASVTPNWTVADRTKYFFGGGEVTMEGSEFTIGLARGRTLSGDWGVSYLRMKVNDGSTVSDTESDCENFSNGCFTFGEQQVTRGVVLSGLKVHKFISFVTIKQRVQIGLNLGVGVGTLKGELERTEYSADFVAFNQQTGRSTGRQIQTISIEPASELFFSKWVPVGDLQGAVSVIVAGGLKVRAASGIGWPGDHLFTLSGVYLFGAN